MRKRHVAKDNGGSTDYRSAVASLIREEINQLSPAQFKVAVHLYACMEDEQGPVRSSIAEIAKATGLSCRTVQSCRAHLFHTGIMALNSIARERSDPTPTRSSSRTTRQGCCCSGTKKTRKIEVNNASLDSPGLAQHVALMRDFMERHLKRRFETGRNSTDMAFWREFRESAIEYLVGSVPELGKITPASQRNSGLTSCRWRFKALRE